MRFITEFNIEDYHAKDNFASKAISGRQDILQSDMGDMLADSFGWQNPVEGDWRHYKLEIEAFPMYKWVEFRKRFLAALPDYDNTSRIRLEHALHDLESFGKPSGDAITNLSDKTEYRGPNSHCKACENERNGIKNIMAQKHTCRK